MATKTTKIFRSTAIHLMWSAVVCVALIYGLRRLDLFAELDIKQLESLSANARSLASTIAQISATMTGFLLASLAMILSLSDHVLIKNMGVSGHLRLLVLRMLVSMTVLMLLVLAGLIVMVLPDVTECTLYYLTGFSLFGALGFMDVLYKLGRVLYTLSPLPNADDKQPVRTLYADE